MAWQASEKVLHFSNLIEYMAKSLYIALQKRLPSKPETVHLVYYCKVISSKQAIPHVI